MKTYQIAKYEKLIKHIYEVINIIHNNCAITLDEKNREKNNEFEISQLYKRISHIQGLCNGLKKHLENIDK